MKAKIPTIVIKQKEGEVIILTFKTGLVSRNWRRTKRVKITSPLISMAQPRAELTVKVVKEPRARAEPIKEMTTEKKSM